jgi:hypothetical protein
MGEANPSVSGLCIGDRRARASRATSLPKVAFCKMTLTENIEAEPHQHSDQLIAKKRLMLSAHTHMGIVDYEKEFRFMVEMQLYR